MALHIDPSATKRHPFHVQTESLLGAVFAAQLDRTARSQNAVPWQPRNLLQDANDLAGSTRPSGSVGDASVARDASPRQRTYALYDPRTLFFCFRWLRLHEKIILLFNGIRKD